MLWKKHFSLACQRSYGHLSFIYGFTALPTLQMQIKQTAHFSTVSSMKMFFNISKQFRQKNLEILGYSLLILIKQHNTRLKANKFTKIVRMFHSQVPSFRLPPFSHLCAVTKLLLRHCKFNTTFPVRTKSHLMCDT